MSRKYQLNLLPWLLTEINTLLHRICFQMYIIQHYKLLRMLTIHQSDLGLKSPTIQCHSSSFIHLDLLSLSSSSSFSHSYQLTTSLVVQCISVFHISLQTTTVFTLTHTLQLKASMNISKNIEFIKLIIFTSVHQEATETSPFSVI